MNVQIVAGSNVAVGTLLMINHHQQFNWMPFLLSYNISRPTKTIRPIVKIALVFLYTLT